MYRISLSFPLAVTLSSENILIIFCYLNYLRNSVLTYTWTDTWHNWDIRLTGLTLVPMCPE